MLNKKIAIALWVLLLGAPSAGGQAPKPCKGNREVVGDCFAIHGRLRAYNGTPSLRIWRVGTKRLLGVHQTYAKDGGEVFWVPRSVSEKAAFGVDIFGDFEVCPLTRERPGEMQIVCVESVSNLVIKDWRKSAKSQVR